jgi:hypothetical protein
LLSLTWLDKRLDPNNVDYNAFYANTSDGIVFLPNVRLSSAKSSLGGRGFIGDYLGIAATADSVHPVWMDIRSNQVEIFTIRGILTH